jgi:hypothetical protein
MDAQPNPAALPKRQSYCQIRARFRSIPVHHRQGWRDWHQSKEIFAKPGERLGNLPFRSSVDRPKGCLAAGSPDFAYKLDKE